MAAHRPGQPQGTPIQNVGQGQRDPSPQMLWLSASRDPRLALRLVQAALESPAWVHRRVEAVQFTDDTSIRWRCSVDFTVPSTAAQVNIDGATPVLIPLTWLTKRVLVNFDLRDEEGAALPVLTTRQNGEAALCALSTLGKRVLNDAICDAVIGDLRTVVMGAPEDASWAIDALATPRGDPREDDQRSRLMNDPLFRGLARRFAQSFLLVTPIVAKPGDRRVLKYSFEDNFAWSRPGRPFSRRVLSVLSAQGWRPITLLLPVGAACDSENYHIEVALPQGAELLELALWGLAPGEHPRTGWHLLGWRSGPKGRLHLRIGRPNYGTDVRAKTTLRACRTGWLASSLMAAMAVTLVLSIGAWRSGTLFQLNQPRGVPNSSASANIAATLVVGITGALAALVFRSGEHQLVSRVLRLLRFEFAVSAALPFAAVGILVFWPDMGTVQWSWTILASLAAVLMILLLGSCVLPRARNAPPSAP